MNIYTTNISKINEDIESFVIAKNKIENNLIKNEELESKMTITEFMNYLNFENSIVYVDNSNPKISKSICIRIFKIKNDIIIVYASDYDDLTFLEELESINYNVKNLKKISQMDFIENTPTKYFIINNEIHILENQ